MNHATTITTVFERLRLALVRLHRGEGGTAMTEFVIALPIFITIFAGMGMMGRLFDAGTSAQAIAIKNTWDATIDVQSTPLHPLHAYPITAGPLAVADAASHDRNTFAKVTDVALYGATSIKGSLGEYQVLLKALDPVANVPAPMASPSAFGGTAAVQDMWEERYPKPIATDWEYTALLVAVPIALLAPRPAGAAGMRYGLAAGTGSATANNVVGGSKTFDVGYTVAVAPYSMGGMAGGLITTGFSRLGLNKHKHYSGMLDISSSSSL